LIANSDDASDQWCDIAWHEAGQLYLVDSKTGNVVGVRTIWPKKQKFTFSLKPNHQYHLYFHPDSPFDPGVH